MPIEWSNEELEGAGLDRKRVASLVRYPFRIFYTAVGDTVEILHIRNTSRQGSKGREIR